MVARDGRVTRLGPQTVFVEQIQEALKVFCDPRVPGAPSHGEHVLLCHLTPPVLMTGAARYDAGHRRSTAFE